MPQSLTTLQSTALGPVLTVSGVSPTVAVTAVAPPGIQTAVDIAGGETVTVTGTGFKQIISGIANFNFIIKVSSEKQFKAFFRSLELIELASKFNKNCGISCQCVRQVWNITMQEFFL